MYAKTAPTIITLRSLRRLFSSYYIAVNTDYINYENSITIIIACEDCGEVYYYENGEYINDCCIAIIAPITTEIVSCLYSHKPKPIFFGNDTSDGYYGVELEIDNGNDRENAAEDIQALGDHIYLKEDGSLSFAGFEIVTHPVTLDYHANSFP